MAEVVPFFAVPFAFSRFPEAGVFNAELRDLLLARAGQGEHANPRPITQRNATTFESRFDLFRDTAASLQKLKDFCFSEMLRVICELNGYDAAARSKLLIYHDAWFHVSRRGG